jgi:hypothetical protein
MTDELAIVLYRGGIALDSAVATDGTAALLLAMVLLARQATLKDGDTLIVSDDTRLVGSVLGRA